MSHPLQCRCGALQGHVVPIRSATRVVCYCRDCQAYARHLEVPGIADPAGGTEIVASLPGQVHVTRGHDRIACLSLSPRGLLRWYAGCCNTPIANTPRNPKLAYAGVVHSVLGDAAAIEASFGPVRMAVNTGSALGPVRSRPFANTLGLARLTRTLLVARLSGAYRQNPFFGPDSGRPIRTPHVLSRSERERASGRG